MSESEKFRNNVPSDSFTYEKGEIRQELKPVAIDNSHVGK